jgi:carbon monoxide dehydrogenase subunit G
MAEVREQSDIPAQPDAVWALVRDFGGLVTALGGAAELEGDDGVGQTRTMQMGAGSPIVERLEERNEDEKRVRYSILQAGPLPVSNYVATMQLSDPGNGATTLTWSSTFEPNGVSEEDAVTAVQRVYRGGFKGLQKHFGGS